ncbi:hypothetical protein CYLTODRAFT_419965 [Cylindrobasidium torrendii FP15055 ss-10]|uniref:Uncharacterized protein n=1 Tax=Cylindrobasidium torrendii FP15055 ss-10 TaxID=1314674 RepID=A0A0D7BJ52_9AGAR|nr:hypothetical protein CYLTODRAFT_419965 [Cylindrobasidium torrendii FP15055 ss-10]
MASSSSSPQITDDDILALFAPPAYEHPPSYNADTAAQRPALAKIVVLPQEQQEFDAPFVRAYPPSLQPFSVSVEDWMQFCDGLGIAMAGSPPMAVVNNAGKILGFSPGPIALITGTIQAGAKAGARMMSKTITDKYLARANKAYFAPRGLCVRLCKTPAARLLARPDAHSSTSTASQVAKTAQAVVLHIPIVRAVVTRFMSPVDHIDYSKSPMQRHFAALDCEGAIAELDFDVPPPKAPEGMAQKVREMAISMERKRTARRQEVKAWRDERHARRRGGRERVMAQIDARKEKNALENLLWLVVLTEDQDASIERREMADSDAEVRVTEGQLEELKREYVESETLHTEENTLVHEKS